MRIIKQPWGLAIAILATLIGASYSRGGETSPMVHLDAQVTDRSVRLEARATGPFEFTALRPGNGLFVLELTGVTVDSEGAKALDSGLVSGYRVISLEANGKPAVRMEVLLRGAAEARIERAGDNDLTVVVSQPTEASLPPASLKTVSASAPALRDADPPAVLTQIKQVELAQNGPQTEVNVRGSDPLNYKVLRLSNPDRLVLDFSGVTLRTHRNSISSNLDPVKRIRMAEFSPGVARVVIDLREAAKYSVISAGNSVRVDFVPRSQEPAAPVSKSLLSAPAVVLPETLTQPAAGLGSPAPGEGSNLKLASVPAGAFVRGGAARSSRPVSQSQAGASGAKYTGEPVSVNLKGVDLVDFFRLIHEISGLNVVVDPAVKGSLTIVLDDVPWDQALDIVLRNNDLDKEIDGNVLRIATKDTVKREAEEERDLLKARQEAAETVTTTRILSYAKADDLIQTLKKFLSSRGDINSDKRSNMLIIRDVPAVMPVIDNLIRQLDKKTQQVEIEARVVAANRSFSRDIGTQLATSFANVKRSNVFGGTGDVGTSPISRTICIPPGCTIGGLPAPPLIIGAGPTSAGTPANVSMPLNTALQASGATSGFSYLFTSPNFALDMIISAAEEKGVGKLLSRPKLTTQNNIMAKVQQGTKIPIQTIINNTISVQFVDAVLKLEVTPHVTDEGTVMLDVKVENDQIDSGIPRVNGIPAIDTQEADTSVLIQDGGTVVIGGIIVSTQRTDVKYVPLFGSLPLIGNLFRDTNVSTSSQELLFFLTPRILPG